VSSSTGTPQSSRAGGPFTGMPDALARAGRQLLIATGVATFALGVLVMAWPGATLLAVGVPFGIHLLTYGVLQPGSGSG